MDHKQDTMGLARLRILHFITRGDDFGGAQNYVYQVSMELLKDGHEVFVVTGCPGVFLDRLLEFDVPATSLGSLSNRTRIFSDLRSMFKLIEAVRDFSPDVVVLHSSKAGVIGRLAARVNRKPAIFTVHGWAFTPGVGKVREVFSRWIERLLASISARIICVSGFDERLGRGAGIPSGLMTIIHNGVVDAPYSGQSGSNRVVMVARFARPKNQELLIEAANRVEGLEVWFVGDGPLRMKCEELVENYGLQERVSFLGEIRDVNAVLRECGVFVLLSNWEAFPLSTLEAMQAGLPVIVSNVGGAPEAVEESVTGFVVENDDLDKIVMRLRTLVEDEALRRRMGAASRVRFEENFTFSEMYHKTVTVYRDVANGRNEQVGSSD